METCVIIKLFAIYCFISNCQVTLDSFMKKYQYLKNWSKQVQPVAFNKIQKFSRLVEQAGESINKYTVNCIFLQKPRNDYTL